MKKEEYIATVKDGIHKKYRLSILLYLKGYTVNQVSV